MSLLDGASECWWLSKSCTVNWDAWSAIGTLLAVAVAIGVSAKEARRRREDQEARAMWLRLELAHPVSTWQADLSRLRRSIEKGRYFAVVQLLTATTEDRNPMSTPSAVAASGTRLHELGGSSKSLAEAVYLVRTLDNYLWLYVEAFRKIQSARTPKERAKELQAIDQFKQDVDKLHVLVMNAAAELRSPFSNPPTSLLVRAVRRIRNRLGDVLRSRSNK